MAERLLPVAHEVTDLLSTQHEAEGCGKGATEQWRNVLTLGSRKLLSEYSPSSRPMEERPGPPHTVLGNMGWMQLIQAQPTRRLSQIWVARVWSLVIFHDTTRCALVRPI